MFTDKFITKENIKILTRFFVKGVEISVGEGSPNGVVSAPIGSIYLNKTAASGQVWEKRTGTGNTGWALVGSAGVEQAPAITTTFDLTTPPTESFHVFNTNANDFNGSPNDSRDWFIRRVRGTPNQTAIDIAVDRGTGESYTRAYSFGAWTPWVGAPVILNASPTLDFGAISAGSAAILTATVTGAALGDVVAVSAPASVYTSNNCTVDAWVSDVDEVSVRILNNGGSGVDPDEGTYKIKVFK